MLSVLRPVSYLLYCYLNNRVILGLAECIWQTEYREFAWLLAI